MVVSCPFQRKLKKTEGLFVVARNQQEALIEFLTDRKTIAKAVEWSMEKRLKVIKEAEMGKLKQLHIDCSPGECTVGQPETCYMQL